MNEMENRVIDSIKTRYGQVIDLEKEPALIIEIIRIYSSDLGRTEAAPEEYVQVETGAVGGVGQANRAATKTYTHENVHGDAISGEITNTELMRELLKIRKDLNDIKKGQS